MAYYDSGTSQQVLRMEKQYQDSLEMAMQQTTCLTAGLCLEKAGSGAIAFNEDFVGALEMRDAEERAAASELDNPELARRVTTFSDYKLDVPVYDLDVLRQLTDPSSDFASVQAAAGMRKKDKVLIDAMDATAYGGKDGNTTYTLPSEQVIAHGSAGMTLEKVLEAQMKLKRRGFISPAQRGVVLWNATAENDFMQEMEVASGDYTQGYVLEGGVVTKWGLFDFHRIEDLYKDIGDGTVQTRMLPYTLDGVSSGIDKRAAYFYAPSAVKRHTARPFRGRIVDDPLLRRWVLMSDYSAGAVRRKDRGVVKVEFRETHIA